VSWATPVGLGWAVPLGATAWLVGSWAAAVRQSVPLPRPLVRRVALRVGAAWGAVVAGGYGSLAWLPGVLDVQGGAVVVVSLALGGIATVCAAGLSLCGIDATSKVV